MLFILPLVSIWGEETLQKEMYVPYESYSKHTMRKINI
jgi:hypothetical protein